MTFFLGVIAGACALALWNARLVPDRHEDAAELARLNEAARAVIRARRAEHMP